MGGRVGASVSRETVGEVSVDAVPSAGTRSRRSSVAATRSPSASTSVWRRSPESGSLESTAGDNPVTAAVARWAVAPWAAVPWAKDASTLSWSFRPIAATPPSVSGATPETSSERGSTGGLVTAVVGDPSPTSVDSAEFGEVEGDGTGVDGARAGGAAVDAAAAEAPGAAAAEAARVGCSDDTVSAAASPTISRIRSSSKRSADAVLPACGVAAAVASGSSASAAAVATSQSILGTA